VSQNVGGRSPHIVLEIGVVGVRGGTIKDAAAAVVVGDYVRN
jgi:hypothetical protein